MEETKDKLYGCVFSTLSYLILPIIILILISTPFILYYSCNIYPENDSFSWQAIDLLQYIGVAAGAAGTIILGSCTVYINMRLQKINERLTLITEWENQREAKSQVPLVDIVRLNGNKDLDNLKVEVVYDKTCSMYRVRIWVKNSFSYAIKSVKVINASCGLADLSFKTRTVEMDENKKLNFAEKESYVCGKALLPDQETVFGLFFTDVNDIKELHYGENLLLCLILDFENENNSGKYITERIKLSFKGKLNMDIQNFPLYTEEIHYEWNDN